MKLPFTSDSPVHLTFKKKVSQEGEHQGNDDQPEKDESMKISKTSKVWIAGVGTGLVAVGGGLCLIPVVGQGAGAVLITSGLKAIAFGTGMEAGIGVIAAGSATCAGIAAGLAHMFITDPELQELLEKLKLANQLYETARKVSHYQRSEIENLRSEIGELLKSKKKSQEDIEMLKARLLLLINKLKGSE